MDKPSTKQNSSSTTSKRVPPDRVRKRGKTEKCENSETAGESSPSPSTSSSSKKDPTTKKGEGEPCIKEESVTNIAEQEPIKCLVKQWTRSQDLDVEPDALTLLTESVSYKLFEVISNAKTVSLHSGGKLTAEVVNEAFKSMNVAPSLGSSDLNFTNFTKQHFINLDTVVNLTDCLKKGLILKVPGPLHLKDAHIISEKNMAVLQTFYTKMCRAVLSGDKKCMNFALRSLRSAKFIQPIVKNLLTMCMLALGEYFSPEQYFLFPDNVSPDLGHQDTCFRIFLMISAISQNNSIKYADIGTVVQHLINNMLHTLFSNTVTEHVAIENINEPKLNSMDINLNESPIELPNNEDIIIQGDLRIQEEEYVLRQPKLKVPTILMNKINNLESKVLTALRDVCTQWPDMGLHAALVIEEHISSSFIGSLYNNEVFNIAIRALVATGQPALRTVEEYLLPLGTEIWNENIRIVLLDIAKVLYKGYNNEVDRWLYEMCGDSVIPYRRYTFNALYMPPPAPPGLKIRRIYRTVTIPVKQTYVAKTDYSETVFESNNKLVDLNREIKFKYNGCRPILVKTKRKNYCRQEIIQNKTTKYSGVLVKHYIFPRRKEVQILHVPSLLSQI